MKLPLERRLLDIRCGDDGHGVLPATGVVHLPAADHDVALRPGRRAAADGTLEAAGGARAGAGRRHPRASVRGAARAQLRPPGVT
eukprot:1179967-Prorocentrum_minimum.AAC.8